MFIVLIAGSLLWFFCYWLPRRGLRDSASKIPGPNCAFILGNVTQFWGTPDKVFDNMIRLVKDFGPVVRLWMVNKLFVILTDPDDIEKIIGNVNVINKDSIMSGMTRYFIGNGILVSNGEEWKKQRKLTTPLFNVNVINSFFKIFAEKSKILENNLKQVADGTSFDIFDLIGSCTLDTICRTVIGVAGNSQTDGGRNIQDALQKISLEALMYRISRPWLYNDKFYELTLTSKGKEYNHQKMVLRKFAKDIIEKKLREHRQGLQNVSKLFVTTSGQTIYSFLDTIIKSESQDACLKTDELVDQVISVVAAGYETTALTMTFFILYVAIHPEIQDQIYQELEEVFQDKDRMPRIEDMSKLPVLDRALKETLRMMPIVGAILRKIDIDFVLPSGYTIPRGSSIAVFHYMVHRNPKYYSQPNRFWPDRWLPENRSVHAQPHKYAYIPFGTGPRHCIGDKYASLQMKCVLSVVLRSFFIKTELSMSDMEKLELGVTFSLGEGKHLVQMQRR